MDQDFLQELVEIFKSEAEDYLNVLSSGLLELENGPNPEVLEQVFRTTHSLKGAARAVNYSGIEEICQVMETIFSRLKNGEMELSPALMDVLMDGVEQLTEIINGDQPDQEADFEVVENLKKALAGELEDASSEKKETKEKPQKKKKKTETKEQVPPPAPETKKDLQKVPSASTKVVPEKQPQPKSKAAGAPKDERPPAKKQDETIRVSFRRIDHLMNQSEELLMIKLKNDHYVQYVQDIYDSLKNTKQALMEFFGQLQQVLSRIKLQNVQNAAQNLDVLKQLLALYNNKLEAVYRIEKEMLQFGSILEKDNYQIAILIENHLTDVRQLMMFPFSTITNYLQTSTRSIARELKKQIELKIIGDEIELDKHVLEALKDPLIHLIRNSIDHGIETPEERIKKGKPEKGHITIEVLPPREQNVVIRISDDGQGIDPEKLKKTALRKQLVTEEELSNYTEAQVLGLIFKSGLSTKDEVSRLSGRGLGMAVVMENIEKLGGSIKVENNPPFGCSFLITLPLNIATSRGILISIAEQKFIIPTRVVETPLRIPAAQLRSVEGRKVVKYKNKNIPVFDLAGLLKLKPRKIIERERLNLMVLKWDDRRIALIVDQILDEREILLKRLNPPLEDISFLAGATILGDGSLVPVLNTTDLFKRSSVQALPESGKQKVHKKKILVVEDSITSRVLLKNVLEGAGFAVQTAVNGAQAWKILQKESFDLIVSDVEMPEMDGITLTKKIRKNEKLKEIPLILLTSLGSKEDQKRGLDAGANAYFVKSSFEQKSLLDLIKTLI